MPTKSRAKVDLQLSSQAVAIKTQEFLKGCFG